MRYFTHYWSKSTVEGYIRERVDGTPLDHTAGNQFTKRGVQVGDVVYVITGTQGKLFLLGKLKVGEILFSDNAAAERLGYVPWSAKEHLIASECTPVILNKEIPLDTVSQLSFDSSGGNDRLKFVAPGVLDRQTARGVREIQLASARSLDALLPQPKPFSASAPSAWRSNYPA